jgi:benzoate membrane transport protein
MRDIDCREASLITFLATTANISLFGVGGAFWGLVLGLISYLVLNGKFKTKTLS